MVQDSKWQLASAKNLILIISLKPNILKSYFNGFIIHIKLIY